MAADFFDVVVLGRDLAASVAGAVLAHRGFRVLVAGVPVEERYSVGPYVLPRAPLAFVGVESPPLKRLLQELNLVQLLRRRLEPNRPAYQLLLPDHRLDVGDELTREVSREMPDALAPLEAVTARLDEASATVESILGQDLILPADGFWDRRDVQRVGARLPDDDADLQDALEAGHPLRALHRLPAAFGADLVEIGAVATARLAELHRRGTFRIDGGRQGLRALLYERLKTHSGEIQPELVAQAIEVKRGKVTGVRFEGKGTVGCSHVLCGMGADRVVELLDGEKPPKRLAEAAALKPAAWRYLLHLVAPLDALPDALGRLAFAVRDPNGDLDGGNALALHLADGYGQHAVLSVEAFASSPDKLGPLRAHIREHVDALLPFLAEHLLLVHSPHDGVAPEGDDKIEPSAAPAREPMDPVWSMPGEHALGICGLPHATGIKHLLLASRQVLPGLGLEGELTCGWGAARLVLQTERKRDLVKGAVLHGG